LERTGFEGQIFAPVFEILGEAVRLIEFRVGDEEPWEGQL